MGVIWSSVVSLKRSAIKMLPCFPLALTGEWEGMDEETAEVGVEMSGAIVLPVVCVLVLHVVARGEGRGGGGYYGRYELRVH